VTAADLAKIRLALAHARYRGKRELSNDIEAHARKVLRELGRPATVETQEQLDALPRWSVIRDGEGWTCEKQPTDDGPDDWFAVKSTRVRVPRLGPDPVIVYCAGEEES
jgi:hypothetical protein